MAQRKIQSYSIVIKSELNELAKAEQFTEKALKENGIEGDIIDDMAIVFTEVVNNAIIHGNQKDSTKKVFIDIAICTDEVEIRVKDEGDGFKPEEVADPLAPENLLKESGRGIFILRSIMDHVDFEFSPQGTTTIMRKKIEQ